MQCEWKKCVSHVIRTDRYRFRYSLLVDLLSLNQEKTSSIRRAAAEEKMKNHVFTSAKRHKQSKGPSFIRTFCSLRLAFQWNEFCIRLIHRHHLSFSAFLHSYCIPKRQKKSDIKRSSNHKSTNGSHFKHRYLA